MKNDKNSDNGINQSSSLIGIKLLRTQSDPIKRHPLYMFYYIKKSKIEIIKHNQGADYAQLILISTFDFF